MHLEDYSAKDIGILGEKVAGEYLRRLGFRILERNMRTAFGELDLIAVRENCLHIVEVKSLRCSEFPRRGSREVYDPGENLNRNKVGKVARMAAWYAEAIKWGGEWQVDGALVWLRRRDGVARIRYYPQIL